MPSLQLPEIPRRQEYWDGWLRESEQGEGEDDGCTYYIMYVYYTCTGGYLTGVWVRIQRHNKGWKLAIQPALMDWLRENSPDQSEIDKFICLAAEAAAVVK